MAITSSSASGGLSRSGQHQPELIAAGGMNREVKALDRDPWQRPETARRCRAGCPFAPGPASQTSTRSQEGPGRGAHPPAGRVRAPAGAEPAASSGLSSWTGRAARARPPAGELGVGLVIDSRCSYRLDVATGLAGDGHRQLAGTQWTERCTQFAPPRVKRSRNSEPPSTSVCSPSATSSRATSSCRPVVTTSSHAGRVGNLRRQVEAVALPPAGDRPRWLAALAVDRDDRWPQGHDPDRLVHGGLLAVDRERNLGAGGIDHAQVGQVTAALCEHLVR